MSQATPLSEAKGNLLEDYLRGAVGQTDAIESNVKPHPISLGSSQTIAKRGVA
jgi:hypothetical protein